MKSIEDRVKQIIAETLDISVHEVNPAAELREVADMIEQAVLAIEIEDAFGIVITDEDEAAWVTVQDAIDYVARRASGKEPA